MHILIFAPTVGAAEEMQAALGDAAGGYDGDDNEARELLKVHIRQIRRRLELDPEERPCIRSIRGFGYMLASPKRIEQRSGLCQNAARPSPRRSTPLRQPFCAAGGRTQGD